MRVAAYIDGFNLYHAIERLEEPLLKWCNMWSLAESYVHGEDTLERVTFYTAYNTWDADKRRRHINYVNALESLGVRVVRSKFSRTQKKCARYDRNCKFFEEKQTDVAIATDMLSDCYEHAIERSLLLSADSDQIPAVQHILRRFPHNRIHMIAPPGRLSEARDLSAACSTFAELTPGRLRQHVLPHEIRDDRGRLVASCPARYGPVRPFLPIGASE